MRISDVSSDVCSSDLPPIRVDAIPGRAYRYSGGGYLIVQQLMQDTTGRSFGDLMHEEVLDRAQMASSTFTQSLPSGRGLLAECGHGFDGTPVAHCGNVYQKPAGTGLRCTPSDLARLGIELF